MFEVAFFKMLEDLKLSMLDDGFSNFINLFKKKFLFVIFFIIQVCFVGKSRFKNISENISFL